MAKQNKEKIRETLSKVKHPEINSDLVKLGMIGEIQENDKGISIELKLPFPGIPIRQLLEDLVRKSLSKEKKKIKIVVSVMSSEERVKFTKMAQENWSL